MSSKLKSWSHRFLKATLIPICLLALSSTGLMHAQGSNAKAIIQGTIVDAGGAAVPGAKLTLEPVHIAVVSDSQGAYRIPDVPAGKYTLTVSYIGFAPLTSNAEVTPGQTLHLDLTMTIANAKQAVQVYAT